MHILDRKLMKFALTCHVFAQGLLDSDKVLAGSVWRVFFEMDCEDITHIELLVHYIRKQVRDEHCWARTS